MKKKSDYARYTFAFASDVQSLADEKHVKVLSFNSKQSKSKSGHNYDVLTVEFLVPRPDRDEKRTSLEDQIAKLEKEINNPDDKSEKEEVAQ